MKFWLIACLLSVAVSAAAQQHCDKWVKPEATVPAGVTQGTLIFAPLPEKSKFQPPEKQTVVPVDVLVDRNGTVVCLEAMAPSPLASAAISAGRQWKYQPFYLNGTSVAIATRIILVFDANGVRFAMCDKMSTRRDTEICKQEYPQKSAFIRGGK